MRRVFESPVAACLAVLSMISLGATGWAAPAAPRCERPVYLTFDTGHMGVASLISDVLHKHAVPATFFLANERTVTGGASLDETWAAWWKLQAQRGHAFGSHTWDHDVWVGDEAEGFRVRSTMGAQAGRVRRISAQDYCEALQRPARHFQAMTGHSMGAVFRAPAGRTSEALLQAAQRCGFTHVGWSPAGFLGDELSSQRYPNEELLRRALRSIRPGDVLVAHLGIWSRQDPWAPAVLEPLILGLKARGLCFATLRDHPQYGQAASRAAPLSP
jgi:peptidoglycan/xylan/chitin deacetylase (PgdA/CDA1 family)